MTEARRIIDITGPLHPGLAGWPGDTPFGFDLAWSKALGASVNVGRVQMSIHSGTHVDAPFHFRDDGAPVDRLDLAPFLGPCRVVDVRGFDPITLDDARKAGLDEPGPPRVLFRTDAWVDRSKFPKSIPVLGEGVVDFLADQGVLLVGFDLPSVDPIDSKDLPNHHALADREVMILEGLDLSRVPPGDYDLIALPLRIEGADGAPARAILLGDPLDP